MIAQKAERHVKLLDEEAQAFEQIRKVMFDFPMRIEKELIGGSAPIFFFRHESTEAKFAENSRYISI